MLLAAETKTSTFDSVILWSETSSVPTGAWAEAFARRFPVFIAGFDETAEEATITATGSNAVSSLSLPAGWKANFGHAAKSDLAAKLRERGFRRPFLLVLGDPSINLHQIFRELFKVRVLLAEEIHKTRPARFLSGWEMFVTPESLRIHVRRALHITEHLYGLTCIDTGAFTDEEADGFVAEIDRHARELSHRKRNVLVLYDANAAHISTVREYLQSVQKYSRHNVTYAIATNDAPCLVDLNFFDAVVIHYSVRLSLANHISPAFAAQLRGFMGPKLLTIQDEYDCTNRAKEWMRHLGIDVVFTCVPEAYIEAVYPQAELPGVRFIQTLTGFVPADYQDIEVDGDPAHRKVLIAYRGRSLPFWYGKLGMEKVEIGKEMRKRCEERGLAVDIDWREESRIYGDGWYDFIKSCRAMLGSESGSNVFDFEGTLRASIEAAQAENPDIGFDEIFERFLAGHEGKIRMNQVSPRIFEAIAFRTGLILFEGEYSGVVKPDVHFIPLKKDFSNFDEVIVKVQDDEYMRRMTERAYNDVIKSGRYSYRQFADMVVGALEEYACARLPGKISFSVTANAEEASPVSYGVMVGVEEPTRIGNYAHVMSARFLPSSTITDGEYVDAVPDVPDYVNKPPQIIQVPYYQNANSFLTTVRTKALLRTLLGRAYMTIPYYPRKTLKLIVAPVRSFVRMVWK